MEVRSQHVRRAWPPWCWCSFMGQGPPWRAGHEGGSGQEAPRTGTAAAPSWHCYHKPSAAPLPHEESSRDRAVVTEKEKMSKKHPPGSFLFFSFFPDTPDKERTFFKNSSLCVCCTPAQRLFFMYLIPCKIDLILFGGVSFKSQDEILVTVNQ